LTVMLMLWMRPKTMKIKDGNLSLMIQLRS
jgi:hypothetical protein